MNKHPPTVLPNIYDYLNFSDYLRAFIEYKRSINKKFSYEFLARRLGIKSRSALAMIANGDRQPSEEILEKIFSEAALTPEEQTYARRLVASTKSRDTIEKDFHIAQLDAMRPSSSALVIKKEVHLLVSDWYHQAILEMTSLKNFSSDPEWIHKNLAFDVSPPDIANALERLVRLGLLVRDENGSLQRVRQSLQTISEVPAESGRSFHRSIFRLAGEAIDTQPVSERYFSGVSFTLSKNKIDEAKNLLVEFERKFVKLMQEDKGDATYHLELGFFSLTKQ